MSAAPLPTKITPKRRGRPLRAASPPPDVLTPETLRVVLQEQMSLVGHHLDEQISGMQAYISALEQRIPSVQAVVDQTAAFLGPVLLKQINEKLEGLASGRSNGHRADGDVSDTRELGSRQQVPLSTRLSDWTSIAGAVADVVLSKYQVYKQDVRLDRAEARADKMYEMNPFAVADAMRASNNPMFAMYTAAFAPTPQVVAEARVRETTDALLVGMRAKSEADRIRKEDQARLRETPSPNSPNSSGSPTNTSPQSPTPTNAGVIMTSETGKSNRPRLTLREVMG